MYLTLEPSEVPYWLKLFLPYLTDILPFRKNMSFLPSNSIRKEGYYG